MAKLGSYYGLCPLIDHRSLLGISEDEKGGIVIVTLDKNIAIKYKYSDQKQVHSWRTKEKFTAPVIFDKELEKYVAVFNYTNIRMWSGNEEFVDKIKKIKFAEQIDTLISSHGCCFIVFGNGGVYPLKWAVENRKLLSKPNDCDHDYMVEVLSTKCDDYHVVGIIYDTQTEQEGKSRRWLRWSKFVSSDDYSNQKWDKIEIDRADLDLTGYLLHSDDSSVSFLALWSDGRIYTTDLETNTSDLLTSLESISSKKFVSMVSLDRNYIAIYGANSNEEGALLVIFSLQFKVVQARVQFKFFSEGARLYYPITDSGGGDDHLFLPVGQHLAVSPFHLDTEQLAALVGSHKPATLYENDKSDVLIVERLEVADWGSGKFECERNVADKIREFGQQGLPESLICEAMAEEFDGTTKMDEIDDFLKYFTDIPEHVLVKLLSLVLESNLLDWVLSKNFSDVLILPHLRKRLNLDQIMTLLKYVASKFSTQGDNNNDLRPPVLPNLTFVKSQLRLVSWGCVLLDSSYQRLLLSKDERILEVLNSFSFAVQEQINYLEDLSQLVPLIDQLGRGKSLDNKAHLANVQYSIESLKLY